MENYITWSELIQLSIAISNFTMCIIAVLTFLYTIFHNKKK